MNFGICKLTDRQKIPVLSSSSVSSGGAVVATSVQTYGGISLMTVRRMESDDFPSKPVFIAGPMGLSAGKCGYVFSGEVPVTAQGSGPVGAPCGPAPNSTQLYTGLPGFRWFDSNGRVVREALGHTYWAVANGTWTDDGGKTTNGCTVSCSPCPDSTGGNPFSFSFNAFIPRYGMRRDPNIRSGDVFQWQVVGGDYGKYGVVIGGLDDPIGTIKIGSSRHGWRSYSGLDGLFPVGYLQGDADFGTLGGTGGTTSHQHDKSSTGHEGDGGPSGTFEAVDLTTRTHIPPYRDMPFIERVR